MSTSPSTPDTEHEPVSHVGGVPWHEAPLPGLWHSCRPQSSGRFGSIDMVERCACGGARIDGKGDWLDKNSRRRDPSEAAAATPENSLGADPRHVLAIEEWLHELGSNHRG